MDSDFDGAARPVAIEVSARPNVRMKVAVPTLEGMLGDVDNNGHVDLDDGLLVAMYSVHPALSLPNHGALVLGDVNCNGQVELEDAGLIASYVAHPSDPAVSSLRIGQRGGYSLDPVTEMVWGSILGTDKSDPTVARILDEVPVLLSGVMPIDGQDRLYLGIDRDYWAEHGGKHIYEALQDRFPVTPLHVEPTIGVVDLSGKSRARPVRPVRTPAPVRLTGPPLSFAESPRTALKGDPKQQHVVGQITVPDDVTVGTVSVGVDITHPFRSDLKIDLVAPSGVATTLYDGVRDGINPEANIVGELPVTTALQGQAAQGTWQLRVGDYEREDTGTLNSWNLTITPASSAQEPQETPHLFLETFQDGLGAWRTTQWEAGSLDSEATIPGEGAGNIVARAQGCPFCFMTLTTPIDLSAYESVTLSFYRWMDAGTRDGEFLGIDIGNNGSYRRLDNWDQQDADGQWHYETFTLTGEDLSDAFTLRFFGIAKNAFTTFALDNVRIAAAPGSVVVEPVPEQPEEEQPEDEEEQPEDEPEEEQPENEPEEEQPEEPEPGGDGGLGGLFSFFDTIDDDAEEAPTAQPEPEDDTQQEPEEEEPEDDTQQEPTAQPDLAVTDATARPLSIQSSYTITVRAKITNSGTGTANSKTVRIYRHTNKTQHPRRVGTRMAGTATTGTLTAGASVNVTSTHTAPTVSQKPVTTTTSVLTPIPPNKPPTTTVPPLLQRLWCARNRKTLDRRMRSASVFRREAHRWEGMCYTCSHLDAGLQNAAPSPSAVLRPRPVNAASLSLPT